MSPLPLRHATPVRTSDPLLGDDQLVPVGVVIRPLRASNSRVDARKQREDSTVEHDLTMNAEHVAELCIAREWSWADLATAMRMSKSTVSRVARGDTRPGRRFIFR